MQVCVFKVMYILTPQSQLTQILQCWLTQGLQSQLTQRLACYKMTQPSHVETRSGQRAKKNRPKHVRAKGVPQYHIKSDQAMSEQRVSHNTIAKQTKPYQGKEYPTLPQQNKPSHVRAKSIPQYHSKTHYTMSGQRVSHNTIAKQTKPYQGKEYPTIPQQNKPGQRVSHFMLYYMACFHMISISLISGGDHPCTHYYLWGLLLCVLLLCSMTHYYITMGHDIARDATISNDLLGTSTVMSQWVMTLLYIHNIASLQIMMLL